MESEKSKGRGLNVSVRSFVISLIVIFALMVLCYVLTLIIPGGQYSRVEDANGNFIIDSTSVYTPVDGGISFGKWLLSPILVLTADGGATIIAVIIFLLVIGGIFNSLGICGLMEYMLNVITFKYGKAKYKLMAVIVFFFMAMGSMIGSFEECVPMVPIVVALAVSLGWDKLTGMGMSLLAVGCGFAAGVCNPFTVGVAQKLSGLPMFSGIWLRIVAFILIYILLMWFLKSHAIKIEKEVDFSLSGFEENEKLSKAVKAFAIILGTGIVIVLCSPFITVLQDYTMIIVAVMFLIAGVVSAKLAGMSDRELGKTFAQGALTILPAVLMILMASSIKFTLEQSNVLDTILHSAVGAASSMPKIIVVLFIYLIVLVMNFFVASGSAKAFMLIPLIVPMAQIFGISPQLCVLAYAFGDGFSNVFYPTNPALLISLGLSDVGYGSWAKWSVKFQILNLLLTSLLLLLGLAVGY